jgi:hypothetical protein
MLAATCTGSSPLSAKTPRNSDIHGRCFGDVWSHFITIMAQHSSHKPLLLRVRRLRFISQSITLCVSNAIENTRLI